MRYIEEFKAFLNTLEGQEIQDKFELFNVLYLLDDFNSIEAERTVPDLMRYDLAAFLKVQPSPKVPLSKSSTNAWYITL